MPLQIGATRESRAATKHLTLKLGSPMGNSHVIFEVKGIILTLSTLVTLHPLAQCMLYPHMISEELVVIEVTVALWHHALEL